MKLHRSCALAALVLTAACRDADGPDDPLPRVTVAAVSGSQQSVRNVINAFKNSLGGPNNASTPGTQPTGYRLVNWGPVFPPLLDSDTLPPTVFTANGLFLRTDGSGFRVDDHFFLDLPGVDSTDFTPFSGNTLFSPVGSTRLDALFVVPGSLATPAAVRAFGVIFTDNESSGTATIEPFDLQGRSLGIYAAPRTTNGLFSFVSVRFDSAVVARVRITSGARIIGTGADGPGNADLVVMDDFVYGEPHAIE